MWCYKGHPINKLIQNGIILLIFMIWKIQDILFVGNLFLNTSCEFIMMTSSRWRHFFAFWTQCIILLTSILAQLSKCYTLQVMRKWTGSISKPFYFFKYHASDFICNISSILIWAFSPSSSKLVKKMFKKLLARCSFFFNTLTLGVVGVDFRALT